MALVATAMAVSLAGCGGGDEDLTTAEQLEKLAGRRLTEAEVDEQLALADLLCGFDDRVLARIWDQLDARQLEFQDYVFGQHCPDRRELYTEARPTMGTTEETDPPTTTTVRGGARSVEPTAPRATGVAPETSTAGSRSTTTRPSSQPTTTRQ